MSGEAAAAAAQQSSRVMSPARRTSRRGARPPQAGLCVLCGRDDDDELLCGRKYASEHNGKPLTVHVSSETCMSLGTTERLRRWQYFCLLYSCKLVRASTDDDTFGIQGFAEGDILKEASRGRRLKCVFCRRMGATLGCCVDACKMTYHAPCGRERDIRFIARDKFESFCSKHKTPPDILLDQLPGRTCASCFGDVDLRGPHDTSVVQCRCCKHVCHRDCVQKFAFVSGKQHFKCSFCNCNDLPESGLQQQQLQEARKCKRRYVRAAQVRGVYIPEKDADWELDGSFDDNEREHDSCDITDAEGKSACICEKGIKYDEPGHKRNKWYIVLCSICAAHGCHRKCRNIPAKDCSEWKCDLCARIVGESSLVVETSGLAASAQVVEQRSKSPVHASMSTTSPQGVQRKLSATDVVKPDAGACPNAATALDKKTSQETGKAVQNHSTSGTLVMKRVEKSGTVSGPPVKSSTPKGAKNACLPYWSLAKRVKEEHPVIDLTLSDSD